MLHAVGRKLVCLHGCFLRFNKNNKIYHNEAFTVSYRASYGRMVVAGCMCVCMFVSFPPVHVLLLPLPLAAHQQQQRGRRHRGCCRVSCRLPAVLRNMSVWPLLTGSMVGCIKPGAGGTGRSKGGLMGRFVMLLILHACAR